MFKKLAFIMSELGASCLSLAILCLIVGLLALPTMLVGVPSGIALLPLFSMAILFAVGFVLSMLGALCD